MKENNIGNLSSIAINYMGEKITYKELLKDWNQKINLTAITEDNINCFLSF